MRTNRRHLAILTTLLISSVAWSVDYQFGVGGDYTTFFYQELPPAAKSTEAASYPSAVAELNFYFTNTFYLKTRYEFAGGVNSYYDGTVLNSSQGAHITNQLAFSVMEADLYFPIFDPVNLYVGYGTRTWSRSLSGSPGYNEIYTSNYIPAGILWTIYKDRFSIALDASARIINSANIQVITSKTFPGGQDSTMSLGATTGERVALPVEDYLSPSFSLRFTPWYEHISFNSSNSVTNSTLGGSIYEPSSTTDNYGLEMMLLYRY